MNKFCSMCYTCKNISCRDVNSQYETCRKCTFGPTYLNSSNKYGLNNYEFMDMSTALERLEDPAFETGKNVIIEFLKNVYGYDYDSRHNKETEDEEKYDCDKCNHCIHDYVCDSIIIDKAVEEGKCDYFLDSSIINQTIYVRHRMPEKSGDYLVVKNESGYDKIDIDYYDNETKKFINLDKNEDIIAWAPIPKYIKKELHLWLDYKTANIDSIAVSVEGTEKMLKENNLIIHTTIPIYLSFDYADRLFVHDINNNIHEITLGKCEGTDKEIRKTDNLFMMLISGAFDWYKKENNNE